MRKIIAIIIIGTLLAPMVSFAQTEVLQALERIRASLDSLLVVLGAIFIIVAGVMFLTAGGNPARIETAKTAVLYALIGLMVAFMADVLVKLAQYWGKGS